MKWRPLVGVAVGVAVIAPGHRVPQFALSRHKSRSRRARPEEKRILSFDVHEFPRIMCTVEQIPR